MFPNHHKKLKIAIISDTYHPQKNGVVVFLDNIISKLKNRNQIVVIAPGNNEKIQLKDGVKIRWVPSVPFPFYEGYRISRIGPKKLRDILEEEKPDVIHCHAPVLLGVLALMIAKDLRIPSIATYHTHFEDYFPHLLKGYFQNILKSIGSITSKKLVKRFYSKADVITAPSSEYVEMLKQYGLKNVKLLENGINLARFSTNAKDISGYYGIPDGKKIALYLGRISFEKKIELLINSFKGSEFVLVIVGSGPYLKKYMKFASGLKNIIFTGFVDAKNLSYIYKSANIFVSASDSEVMPISFIEAMACGLPIVCPRSRGTVDLVKDNKNGLLFEAGNYMDLSKKVKELLSDNKKMIRMSVQAKKMARKFSIDNCYKKTLEIYRGLLDG